MSYKWKQYILWFAQEHVNFRKQEVNAIVDLFNLPMRLITNEYQKPFWIVEFPDDDSACKLASRSILLRCVLELWSYAKDIPTFHTKVKEYIGANSEVVAPFFQPTCRFKISVETYNKHYTQSEKVDKIEKLEYMPIKGKVDLKTPNVEWWYIEFFGLNPVEVPKTPYDILLGRVIASGQRFLLKHLSLKERKFIGNTSMDPQLSILMANQALVREGDLVLDPFVGTGSLLVSAAKFGGFVIGADIDYMMLHAKCRPSRITQKKREKDESVHSNLRQYGCETRYLDVIVSDFSNSVWRQDIKFDSIITDPPYGIREATEKVKTKFTTCINRTDEMPHYPSTSHYSLQNLYKDLLEFAAKHLTIKGRLVCWLPYHREDYSVKMLPQNDHLVLIANSEQQLSGLTSRRLLTYEKRSEPDQNPNSIKSSQEYAVKEFRQRYFDNSIASRAIRRTNRAELREIGRLEALKRGKIIVQLNEIKK